MGWLADARAEADRRDREMPLVRLWTTRIVITTISAVVMGLIFSPGWNYLAAGMIMSFAHDIYRDGRNGRI